MMLYFKYSELNALSPFKMIGPECYHWITISHKCEYSLNYVLLFSANNTILLLTDAFLANQWITVCSKKTKTKTKHNCLSDPVSFILVLKELTASKVLINIWLTIAWDKKHKHIIDWYSSNILTYLHWLRLTDFNILIETYRYKHNNLTLRGVLHVHNSHFLIFWA